MLSSGSLVSTSIPLSRIWPHGFVACACASSRLLNYLLHKSHVYLWVFMRWFLTWFLRAALLENISSQMWHFWLLWTEDVWLSKVLPSLHVNLHALHFSSCPLLWTAVICLSRVLLSLHVNLQSLHLCTTVLTSGIPFDIAAFFFFSLSSSTLSLFISSWLCFPVIICVL
jgi:hypothetical protein